MKRRHVLLAGAALPFTGWAQSPDRNLIAGERKEAPGVAAGKLPLLVAPRRALVIGNSGYGFAPLKNPANDAKAIGEELRRTGFDVQIGLDLSRQQMLEAIRAYVESLTRAQAIGIFYFAGHGVQLAWRNYLLPIDAEIRRVDDIEAKCVDVNAVIEGIAKAANPMNVVILDACRENPFAGVKLEQKGLSQLDAPAATLLAYATAPGNLASDGDGANGLYTEQLLKEMKVPDAKIEDVFKRVRLTVRRRSQGAQIPWESTSLEEDFWFLPPRDQLRLAQEEAERVRKAQEAERRRLEQLEKARQEKARQAEAERLQREIEAERARQAELEEQRREQRQREQEEAQARAYEAELALWEKASGAQQPGPIEDYLRRYPSGHFAELAQLELDAILSRQGEKPVQIVNSAANPFTQGTARADLGYKVGDRYSFVELDRETKATRRFTNRVTEVNDSQVIFNNGRLIVDRLGNFVKLADGRQFTPRQDQPLEYAVGKKWTTRYFVRNAKGRSSDSEMTFRIARRETVTVPAGTFDCFVVEGSGWSFTDTGLRIRLGWTRWMAPARVRLPIINERTRRVTGLAGARRRQWEAKVLQNDRVELVEYSQS